MAPYNLRVRPANIVKTAQRNRRLSSSPPKQATPLFMLAALSHARETQHYSRRSGLGVTHHVPNVEAIKSSEVDPYVSKMATTTSPGRTNTRASSAPATFGPSTSSAADVAAADRNVAAAIAHETSARQELSSAILAGDPRIVATAAPADAISRNRMAFAIMNAIPGSEVALSAMGKERLRKAQDKDQAEKLGRQGVEFQRRLVGVKEVFGEAVEGMVHGQRKGKGKAVSTAAEMKAVGESQTELEGYEKQLMGLERQNAKRLKLDGDDDGVGGGPGNTKPKEANNEAGQVALMALVVGLVGVNVYMFKLLEDRHQETERLVGRIQKLENSGRERRRAERERKAQREAQRLSRQEAESAKTRSHALLDYQMQLDLLEQQNNKRRLMEMQIRASEDRERQENSTVGERATRLASSLFWA